MPKLSSDQVPECFQRPKLDNVNEVELDLLLTAAVATSIRFASFLFDRAFQRTAAVALQGVWRGSWGTWNPTQRQTQRDVSVLANYGTKCLLLIENKFVEQFQPEQSVKYREFGEFGLERGWWSEYRTCLCGPTHWISTYQKRDEWDTWLTFSEIREWFERQSGVEPMSHFMSAMMRQADAKARANKSDRAS